MNNYQEELKDPRWQKKRLEIMDRDNFTCKSCGCSLEDGKPLNVHHIKYKRGLSPWEYPNNLLITLCEDCHQKTHGISNKVETKENKVESFFFTHPQQLEVVFNSNIVNAPTKVLWKFLEWAEYNTNKVSMNTNRVEQLLQGCCISRVSYYRAIKDLTSRKILFKDKNTYMINAIYFWKGDAVHRNALINQSK